MNKSPPAEGQSIKPYVNLMLLLMQQRCLPACPGLQRALTSLVLELFSIRLKCQFIRNASQRGLWDTLSKKHTGIPHRCTSCPQINEHPSSWCFHTQFSLSYKDPDPCDGTSSLYGLFIQAVHMKSPPFQTRRATSCWFATVPCAHTLTGCVYVNVRVCWEDTDTTILMRDGEAKQIIELFYSYLFVFQEKRKLQMVSVS